MPAILGPLGLSELLFLFFILCAPIILIVLLVLFVVRRDKRRRGRQHQQLGVQAEQLAAQILRQEGFQILQQTPRLKHQLHINGEPRIFEITPDFLVEKDGQRLVVEVKRREQGGGIQEAQVRRQVFEYLHASGLPCLLVTLPDGEIDLVEKLI